MLHTRQFRAEVAALADRHFPNHRGGEIRLRINDDVEIRVRFTELNALAEANKPLTPMQTAILQALTECDGGPPITGDVLAERAGYGPSSGAWRKAIAELIAGGRIANCRPGYVLSSPAVPEPSLNGNGKH